MSEWWLRVSHASDDFSMGLIVEGSYLLTIVSQCFPVACSDAVLWRYLLLILADLFILSPIYSITMQRLASLTSSYLALHRFEIELIVFQTERRVSFESPVPIISTLVIYWSNKSILRWRQLSSPSIDRLPQRLNVRRSRKVSMPMPICTSHRPPRKRRMYQTNSTVANQSRRLNLSRKIRWPLVEKSGEFNAYRDQ